MKGYKLIIAFLGLLSFVCGNLLADDHDGAELFQIHQKGTSDFIVVSKNGENKVFFSYFKDGGKEKPILLNSKGMAPEKMEEIFKENSPGFVLNSLSVLTSLSSVWAIYGAKALIKRNLGYSIDDGIGYATNWILEKVSGVYKEPSTYVREGISHLLFGSLFLSSSWLASNVYWEIVSLFRSQGVELRPAFENGVVKFLTDDLEEVRELVVSAASAQE